MVRLLNDTVVSLGFFVSWIGWSSSLYFLTSFGTWSLCASILLMSVLGLIGKLMFPITNKETSFTVLNMNPRSVGELVFMLLAHLFVYIVYMGLVLYWHTVKHLFQQFQLGWSTIKFISLQTILLFLMTYIFCFLA